MSQPFNITISVPSGNPDKLRIIEKTNRLSQALVFNRSELSELAKTRKELEYTGVYMLVNNSGDSLPEIYVGEGESVLKRLRSHSNNIKKDFWEWAIVFINRDNSLHKSHIQFIEAELIERATSNKRCKLHNDKLQNKPSIPESILFEAQDLLNDIYQIVPLLGISAFEVVSQNSTPPEFENLQLQAQGIYATGDVIDGKIVVKANSQSVAEHKPSASSGCIGLREELVKNGVLDNSTTPWTFTQDYTFESPSRAANAILGRSANGRTEWKTKNGVTLKTLQDA
jgi:hypothetical protein